MRFYLIRWGICYESVTSMWCHFFSITRIYGSGNQGWKMEWRHSFHLLTHLQNFCISSLYLRLCWFEFLTSWEKSAFTRGHSGFIKVEVETATWPFCASPFSEATSTLLHWLAWLILIQRSNWVTTTNGSWRNTSVSPEDYLWCLQTQWQKSVKNYNSFLEMKI